MSAPKREKEGQIIPHAQIAHTAELNTVYEALDVNDGDGDNGNFLFGWQCNNPFAGNLISAIKKRAEHINYGEYTYFDEDAELAQKVLQLHERLDGSKPQSVFCGAGSTSMLFAFAAYLRRKNVKEVYFIPPLYFTLHIALDLFGIKAIRVAEKQSFEDGFKLNLPIEKETVLLMSDPVWYVGKSVPKGIMDEISRWQSATNALVFVDGSFQYMPWTTVVDEASSRFDPARTVRLICATKLVGIHGYRFSYTLLPDELKGDFSWTYTNINGSGTADGLAFAHEAIAAIESREITNKLTNLAFERYHRACAGEKIRTVIEPDCGYFTFAEVLAPLPPNYPRVDGKFFDQPNYPGYTKVNLLSPSIGLIED